jgi:hypothetical protein
MAAHYVRDYFYEISLQYELGRVHNLQRAV